MANDQISSVRTRLLGLGLLALLAVTLLPAAAEAAPTEHGVRISLADSRSLGASPRCARHVHFHLSAGRRQAEKLRLRRCRGKRSREATSSASPTNLYWGAWIGSQLTGEEAPWDMGAVSSFEALAGKSLSMVNFSSPFADCSSRCNFYKFPTGSMENIRRHGAIPFFSWASDSTPTSLNEPEFQLSDVIAGTYDSYIREFAEAAKQWGHPFFLRFNWEMNGNWFPWSEGVNGNQPGEYVTAWRHVHDIFTAVGATNATWVWCPNVDPNGKMQNLASLYPGDEYVDWTGLDGYNWGTNPVRPDKWRTFDQLFHSTYSQIVESIAPSKPLVVSEVGSTESGGSKATWIKEMLNQVPVDYPKIRGLLWFDNYEDGMDWPIETSTSAVSAFASGIQSSSYLGDEFGSLGAGPIPPPS